MSLENVAIAVVGDEVPRRPGQRIQVHWQWCFYQRLPPHKYALGRGSHFSTVPPMEQRTGRVLAFTDNQGIYLWELNESSFSKASRVDATEEYLFAQRTHQVEIAGDEIPHWCHAGQADDLGTEGAKALQKSAGVETFTGRIDDRYPPAVSFKGRGYREQAQGGEGHAAVAAGISRPSNQGDVDATHYQVNSSKRVFIIAASGCMGSMNCRAKP
jgi:hypothetical protein